MQPARQFISSSNVNPQVLECPSSNAFMLSHPSCNTFTVPLIYVCPDFHAYTTAGPFNMQDSFHVLVKSGGAALLAAQQLAGNPVRLPVGAAAGVAAVPD